MREKVKGRPAIIIRGSPGKFGVFRGADAAEFPAASAARLLSPRIYDAFEDCAPAADEFAPQNDVVD